MVQFGEDRLIRLHAVIWDTDHDNAQAKPSDILLVLKALVDRHENVKLLLSQVKKLSIL
jgi:hypothetical protein